MLHLCRPLLGTCLFLKVIAKEKVGGQSGDGELYEIGTGDELVRRRRPILEIYVVSWRLWRPLHFFLLNCKWHLRFLRLSSLFAVKQLVY